MSAWWAVHVAATAAMTGLIWFVQVVHYPLMARVGAEGFAAYERAHTRRTSWVVMPLMTVELATAVALVVPGAGPLAIQWAAANVAALAGIWAVTFFVSVPCHRRLERGWDAAAHRRLVRANWVRTALWSGRMAGLAAGGSDLLRSGTPS